LRFIVKGNRPSDPLLSYQGKRIRYNPLFLGNAV
jgi:hypothetical protein